FDLVSNDAAISREPSDALYASGASIRRSFRRRGAGRASHPPHDRRRHPDIVRGRRGRIAPPPRHRARDESGSFRVIDYPSPNHTARPAGKPIDLLLMHYTGMRDAESALRRLSDPEAQVSSHYLIDEDGRVYWLVDEERRAWHAGVSYWAGERDING